MRISTFVSCGLLAAGIALPVVAFAQATELRPFAQRQPHGPEPQRGAQQPMQRRVVRAPERDERARMSAEQRRQLRQDIQDAGRDIYRPVPRERRDAWRSGRR